MAKCHNNRRKRERRDKKFLLNLAKKRYGEWLFKKHKKDPQYYTLSISTVETFNKRSRRYIGFIRYKFVPNAKLLALSQEQWYKVRMAEAQWDIRLDIKWEHTDMELANRILTVARQRMVNWTDLQVLGTIANELSEKNE